MHGLNDTREPIERGRRLYDAAHKLGGDVDFIAYADTNHGFGQNFGTPAADDAFKRALAFLGKTLKGE
jgi:dipeptidyl aminopeptidase/acylaminoacyl peptidase